jgi:hypothetical protein
MFRQLINPFNKKSLPSSKSNSNNDNEITGNVLPIHKKHVLSPLLSPNSQPWTSKSYIRFSLLKGKPSKIVAIAKQDTPILSSLSSPSFPSSLKHLTHLQEKYKVNLTPPPLFIKIRPTQKTPLLELNMTEQDDDEVTTDANERNHMFSDVDDMETLLLPPPSLVFRSKRYSLLDTMYMYNPDNSYRHSLFDHGININDTPRFVQQKTFLKCADESNDSNKLVWEMPKYIIPFNDPLYEEIMQIVNIIEIDVFDYSPQVLEHPRHIKKHIIQRDKSPIDRHISYPIMYKYNPTPTPHATSASKRHFETYYEHVKSAINPSDSYLRLYSAFIDRFTQMRYPKSSSAAFNALLADWNACISKHQDMFTDIYNDINHASLSIREMNSVYLY